MPLVPETSQRVVLSLIECAFGQTEVFLASRVARGMNGGLVQDGCSQTFSVHWALVAVAAVAAAVCASSLSRGVVIAKDLVVVGFDDRFYIRHAAVTDLYCLAVEYLM